MELLSVPRPQLRARGSGSLHVIMLGPEGGNLESHPLWFLYTGSASSRRKGEADQCFPHFSCSSWRLGHTLEGVGLFFVLIVFIFLFYCLRARALSHCLRSGCCFPVCSLHPLPQFLAGRQVQAQRVVHLNYSPPVTAPSRARSSSSRGRGEEERALSPQPTAK